MQTAFIIHNLLQIKNLEKVLTYLHEYDRIFVPLKGAYFFVPY